MSVPQRLLRRLDLLHPVAYSFANSVDGRKVLFEEGLFGEYADDLAWPLQDTRSRA